MIIKSNILKIFSLIAFSSLWLNPINAAEKLFSGDKEIFNLNFIRPDFHSKTKLRKKINLSFYETDVSEILVILSRIGDFNLVFPKSLDRKISINLHNTELASAIDDVLMLAQLQKTFHNNTLKVSKQDNSALSFRAVKLSNIAAEKAVLLLNQKLFKQIIISQDPSLAKPYAFINPSSHDLVIVANQSQMQIAENYIRKIDSKSNLKELRIEVYKVMLSETKSELYTLQKYTKAGHLTKIPYDLIISREYQSLSSKLKTLLSERIRIEKYPLVYDLKANKILLSKVLEDKYTLEFRNTVLEIDNENVISYLDLAKNIFREAEINRKNRNDVILILIKFT